MTDRERLIELFLQPMNVSDFYDKEMIAKAYADRILADGWIRPPCKVGDTVYCIDELKGGIFKGEVNIVQMIGKDNFGVEVLVYDYSGEMPELFDAFDYDSEDFGVDVFVGKNAEEEAEKALKEREME